MRSLLRRRQLGEHRDATGGLRQLVVVHGLNLRTQEDLAGVELHLAADLARDDIVVAGQDLHRHALLRQRRDGRPGALLRWIEEGDVTEQRQVALVGDGVGRLVGGHHLVGHSHDPEPVRIERDRLLFGRRKVACIEQTCRSVDLVARTDREDLLHRPLADEDVLVGPVRHDDRQPPAGKIERDLVDLGEAVVDAQRLVHSPCVRVRQRRERILQFSNRDGKGKRKVIDLASLSSFQVISLV